MNTQLTVEGVNLRKNGFSTVMLQKIDPETKKPAMQVVLNFADPREAGSYVPGETVTVNVSKANG